MHDRSACPCAADTALGVEISVACSSEFAGVACLTAKPMTAMMRRPKTWMRRLENGCCEYGMVHFIFIESKNMSGSLVAR